MKISPWVALLAGFLSLIFFGEVICGGLHFSLKCLFYVFATIICLAISLIFLIQDHNSTGVEPLTKKDLHVRGYHS